MLKVVLKTGSSALICNASGLRDLLSTALAEENKKVGFQDPETDESLILGELSAYISGADFVVAVFLAEREGIDIAGLSEKQAIRKVINFLNAKHRSDPDADTALL